MKTYMLFISFLETIIYGNRFMYRIESAWLAFLKPSFEIHLKIPTDCADDQRK